MRELLLVAAVVGLATTGCVQNRFFGNRASCGQACEQDCCPIDDGYCDDGYCDDMCCDSCDGSGCGMCNRAVGRVASGFCPQSCDGYPQSYNCNPSPPTAQTAYPYYTVRGPRDFLQANPPSIGPY